MEIEQRELSGIVIPPEIRSREISIARPAGKLLLRRALLYVTWEGIFAAIFISLAGWQRTQMLARLFGVSRQAADLRVRRLKLTMGIKGAIS